MDIASILEDIRPGAIWALKNNNYDLLDWLDTVQTKPTLEELEEAWEDTAESLRLAAIPDITPRQMRLWLVNAGIFFTVLGIIDAISDPQAKQIAQIEWEYSASVSRTHSLVTMVGQILGMTSTELDEAFHIASTL